jgi:outer membrane protein OmpA-like peptidoglycan-associated protein
MKKRGFIILLATIISVAFGNVYAEELFELLTPNRLTKMTYQILEENRLLVSVTDHDGNPVRELKLEDFVIQKGIKKASLLSVESLETSEDIGLNIVLVVDNSVSMKDRKAIKPLLSALEEFFKILRPIDDVHVVVFDQKGARTADKWSLHTKTRHSSNATQLREFFQSSFDTGLSAKTYLYEAILEGVKITRKMPEKQNKLLVIFSDGEDINSDFDSSVVESAAGKVENLKVYAIDYMQAATMDPFLKTFAESQDGRIWKASSATELLPIFKEFSTTLRYQYVIAYRFLDPPRGILNMGPADIHLEMVTMLDGSPVEDVVFFETGKSAIPEWYALFPDRTQALGFQEDQPKTALERYHHVLNYVGKRLADNQEIRACIVGCNSSVGIEKDNVALSEKRAEAVKTYLGQVWDIDFQRLAIEARNLPEKASPLDLLGGRAENQRVEILFEDPALQATVSGNFIAETNGIHEIQIQPDIVAEYGVAHWELRVLADTEPVKIVKGTDDLKELYNIALDDLGRHKLAASENLEARIKVVDAHGDVHETAAASPIVVSKLPLIHELIPLPHGSLVMEPAKITIEELTTIDSAPLLNYVFFGTSESEIHERYKLFASQADTISFEESNLKGSMEKYLHLLNILGARLKRFPDTHLTIVGCNSNYGKEKGRTDLSRSRAEAVRAYLKYMWGVDGSRMDVEARNLPKAASTNRIVEGRAENQRVEMYSDSPEILDTTKSTYVQEISDAEVIRITPEIAAGYGIKQWRLDLKGDGILVDTLSSGSGDPDPSFTFNLKQIGLGKIGLYENIMAEMVMADEKGQALKVTGPSASVKFIKRKERVSQKVGYKVLEKYALILFEYDSSEIKDRNRVIVDRIIERLKAFPRAVVKIVGHTDNIGKEEYNLKLSERRAKTVYKQMLDAGMTAGNNSTYEGAGPHKPLFDNALPEGRALNRTVTVSLEYEKQ